MEVIDKRVLAELKDRIHAVIDDVIVKNTYSKGKNAGLRTALVLIEDIEKEL